LLKQIQQGAIISFLEKVEKYQFTEGLQKKKAAPKSRL